MSELLDEDSRPRSAGPTQTMGDTYSRATDFDAATTMMPASFLTEVDAAAVVPDISLLLEPVRSEHTKVQSVVAAFGKKVENLLDRQRDEYTQAYEFHMFDVQQELHRLREKAVLIANDTTREEKLKKLQEDEQKWRADAMRLDQETAKCKRTLHALSKKIGLAERERDWLLRRLREAKNVLKELVEEHGNAIAELSILSANSNPRNAATSASNNHGLTTTASAGGLDAASTASATYTLEVLRSRSHHKLFSNEPFPSTADWKRKLNVGPLLVSRDASIMAMDRFLREVASGDQSPHPARRVGDQGGDDAEDFESMRPTRNKAFGGAPRDQENTHTAALAALVSLRSCHADVRLLLRQCEDAAVVAQMASGLLTSDVAVGTRNNSSTINAAPGEASRQKSKKSLPMSSMDSVLHRAMKLIEARQLPSSDMDANTWRVQYGALIHDLMRLPEAYSAIADLLGHAPPPEAVGASDEYEAEGGCDDDTQHGLRAILPPRLVHSLRATAYRTEHHRTLNDGGGNAVFNRAATEGSGSEAADEGTYGELREPSAPYSNERFYSEYDKNMYDDIDDDDA